MIYKRCSWETYNCWTLSSSHRSSSWILDNWLLWRNLPKQVLTMIYVKESVTHVTTHPCCKYTVYQQSPQLNSYDYSAFWKVTLGNKIKVLQSLQGGDSFKWFMNTLLSAEIEKDVSTVNKTVLNPLEQYDILNKRYWIKDSCKSITMKPVLSGHPWYTHKCLLNKWCPF